MATVKSAEVIVLPRDHPAAGSFVWTDTSGRAVFWLAVDESHLFDAYAFQFPVEIPEAIQNLGGAFLLTVVATLNRGGALLELDEARRRYRVASIDGVEILPWKRMEDLRPIRWMIEVAGEHFPELAAAMRARAMHGVLDTLPSKPAIKPATRRIVPI